MLYQHTKGAWHLKSYDIDCLFLLLPHTSELQVVLDSV